MKLTSLFLMGVSVGALFGCGTSTEEDSSDDGEIVWNESPDSCEMTCTAGFCAVAPFPCDDDSSDPSDPVSPPACDTTISAAGDPALIDDFNDPENSPHQVDGRAGVWIHKTWDSSVEEADYAYETDEDGDGYLRFFCEEESWCNSAWDSGYAWEQIASLHLSLVRWPLDGSTCYDISTFDGVRFRARSSQGNDRLLLQVDTPDGTTVTGEVYRSQPVELSQEWQTFEVLFSSVAQPSWSTVSAPLYLNRVVAMSFIVRTVEEQYDGVELVGETLLPYDIHLDDVSFF